MNNILIKKVRRRHIPILDDFAYWCFPNTKKKFNVVIVNAWEGQSLRYCFDTLEEAKEAFRDKSADTKEDFIIEFVKGRQDE